MRRTNKSPKKAGSLEARVGRLLSRMTLEEKLGQLNQLSGFSDETGKLIKAGKVGSLLNLRGAEIINTVQRIAVEESRLRIPLLIGNDVIHGYRTTFPIPLGETASWEPELMERTAKAAAREAAAAGTRWTFAPMVDIARDPRWGRIAEGAGEDPYLGCRAARARVRGFQHGGLESRDAVAACAKHYVAYGAAEGGRDYNTVDLSLNTLRNVFLPPFQSAVSAGVATFMSAFNDLNGVPASANRFTLTQILRKEWKFKGFVVSDWNSIGELVNHGLAAGPEEAARLGFLAGVDMDMISELYPRHLGKAVRNGTVPLKAINEAVRKILRIKFRLGLFDRPYADLEREKSVLACPEHMALAREATRRSLVLLKNDGGVLPLPKDIRRLAVVGPLADNREDLLGTWNCQGRPEEVVTVLEGIRAAVSPETQVLYSKGCEIEGGEKENFAEPYGIAVRADAAVLVLGESQLMSGEGGCRTDIGLPGHQEELLKMFHASGVPTVLVLMSGRPLAIPWPAANIPAIIAAWHPGTQGGNAVADVLFGDYNPSGRLPVSFPRSAGQIPVYYAQKNTGRPPLDDNRTTSKYLDSPNTPLYPFGFGLSYTTFSYDRLKINPARLGKRGQVRISVQVTNSGKTAGEEVVQLYIRDVAASQTRPVKELKGFQKIVLAPGELKEVVFTIPRHELGFLDEKGRLVVEPGEFRVWVGPNSAQGLEGRLLIAGRP